MLNSSQSLRQERYRIIRTLAEGNLTRRYLAFDEKDEQNVVIREFCEPADGLLTFAERTASAGRFAELARVVAPLRHEALIPVLEFFSENDCHYLVSEYVEAQALATLLAKREAAFPLGDTARWTDRLLDALGYLHASVPAVFHLALAPERLYLTSRGQIMIEAADLVRFHQPADDNAPIVYQPLEQIWQNLDPASKKVIVADYDEISERRLEEKPDEQSDVFSLGATAFHLLTNQTPPDALSRSIELLDGKTDPLKPAHFLNHLIPSEISEVLIRALAIRREERFPSTAMFRESLRGALAQVRDRQAVAAVAGTATMVAAATKAMPVLTAVKREEAPNVMTISAPTDEFSDQSTITWEDDVTPSFVFSTSSVGLFGRLAAGFGLAVLVGVVGVLGFLVHSNSGQQLTAAIDREIVAAPVVAELKPAAVQTETETAPIDETETAEPMMSAEPTILPETAASSSTRRDERTNPVPTTVKSPSDERAEKKIVRVNTLARNTDLVAAQVIPARKTVSPAPKQTVRKKVTLDDLLNDN